MHFSEPEFSIFFLGEAPKHPLRSFTTDVYFQKFSFNLLHIFGKTLGPPLSKNPGSAPGICSILERRKDILQTHCSVHTSHQHTKALGHKTRLFLNIFYLC